MTILLRFCLFLIMAMVPTGPTQAALDFGTLKATPVMVTGIHLEDKNSVPIMFGSSATLTARTYPEGRSVDWAVQPDSGSEAKISYIPQGNDQVIILPTEQSGSGWVTVEASIAGGQAVAAKVYVGCQICTGDSCNVVGNGVVNIGSIDISISLGRAEEGMPAGDLFVRADKPSTELFTPATIRLSTLSENVTPVSLDDILRQVVTPEAFIVIEPDTASSYEIRFYDKSDQGEQQEDGLYQLTLFADPFAVWRLENPSPDGAAPTDLLVQEYREGLERRYDYRYTEADNTWSLTSGNGLRLETRREYRNEDGDRVERTTVSGPDGNVATISEKVYREFPWGGEVIAEISDPDGDRLVTEISYYEEDGPGYSLIKTRLNPDRSWTRYRYDETGRTIAVVTPWLDTPPDSAEDQARLVVNDYTPLPGDRNEARDRTRPRTVTEMITGIVVGKTFYHYATNAAGERVETIERCAVQDCTFGDHNNLRSVATYYPEGDGPQARKIQSRLDESGLVTSYRYQSGSFAPAVDPAKAVFTPGDGAALRVTIDHGSLEHPDGIASRTTRETTITDWLGHEVMTERFVKTETGFERIDWTYHTYNTKGRRIETLHANHTRTESSWSCCGKADSTDATGITSRYGYDDLGRNTSVFNEATGLQTEFTYDAAGRRLSTTERHGELTRTTAARYDLSGRLLATTDPAGLVTTSFYTATETALLRPGGAEEITRTHHDGSLRSYTGSGVIDRFYRYGVNPDGSRFTTVYLGTDNGPRWETTTRDLLGRIVRSEKPGCAAPIVTTSVYDDRNRLIGTATTGTVPTRTDYDELNVAIMTGLDVDGNGRLEQASSDRIEERRSGYVKSDGAWWQQEQQLVYPETGSDRPTVVSTALSRLSGWDGSLVSERIVIDSHGAQTVFRETLERSRRLRSTTVLSPDSTIAEEHHLVNGLPVAAMTKTGRTTTYRYDGLGRRIAVTDPRTGTTRSGYDEHHRLAFVEDSAGNRTSYAYDPQTGLKISETNAENKKTRFSYTPLGQLERRWGSAAYPVQYTYNDYGEQVALTTFRTEQGWDRPDWPEDATGDKTSWQYQESTGLLLAKDDATGTGPRYTYDEAGRLQSRTWARGVVTRYGYLSTGELSSIEYSDATPAIRFSYDRLGRKKTVSDVLGTRSYDYDADHLQLLGEQQHGLVPATIKRRYDNLGRPAGISLDDDYAVNYRYDQASRFAALDWTSNSHRGATTYDYLADSDLLAGYRSGTITVSYAYEAQRDLKTAVSSTSHDRELSRYEYRYDRLGRRINVATTGSAFPDPAFALYGYNDRNELTTAARYAGDDLTDQSAPLPERERFYDYDPIGNRRKAVAGRSRYDYRINPLNQYETITAPPDLSPLELFYDQDGNLTKMKTTAAGTRYVFNGENRVIIVEPTEPRPGDSRLRFSYDYRGRRVLKTVSTYTDNTWHLTGRTGFIYDDWNLIAERNLDDDTAVQYVWGLDLSNTLQGAGGIGGLLVRVADEDQQHYLYDANGNVGQLVDGKGKLVAAYEYDAYGKQVQITGSKAAENPFRFSTKYYDALSGLYYYGYRYYSAELGRWVNRDPIGRFGGVNLQLFALNSPVNNIDTLGLFTESDLSELIDNFEVAKKYYDIGSNIYNLTAITISALNGDEDAIAKMILFGLDKTFDAAAKRAGIPGAVAWGGKQAIKTGATIGFELGYGMAGIAADWECEKRFSVFKYYLIDNPNWYRCLYAGEHEMPKDAFYGDPIGGEFKLIKPDEKCNDEVWIKCRVESKGGWWGKTFEWAWVYHSF